jgi:hypothetical protein
VGKLNSTGGYAVRRSAAQGRALVEQWRRSGESVTEFCRGQAVGAQVLRYWLSRETARKESGATAGFYVVSAAEKEREGESVARASSSGAAGGRPGSAVIVVLPAVTSAELVRTLRGLLEEVRA